MKRFCLALVLLAGCRQEPQAATNTIAPAEPRPAPAPATSMLGSRPVITTTGSVPPANQLAPGTQLVTITTSGIEMRSLLPRAHTAFRLSNRTATAHELELRGTGNPLAVTVPANGAAVLQALLSEEVYELVCTTPDHSERVRLTTYRAGVPLTTTR